MARRRRPRGRQATPLDVVRLKMAIRAGGTGPHSSIHEFGFATLAHAEGWLDRVDPTWREPHRIGQRRHPIPAELLPVLPDGGWELADPPPLHQPPPPVNGHRPQE